MSEFKLNDNQGGNVMYPDADQCPEQIKQSLALYVERGLRPGSFLEAVLCNNLMEAVGCADHINLAALPHICAYIYNEIPATCHGSPECYRDWLEHAHKNNIEGPARGRTEGCR